MTVFMCRQNRTAIVSSPSSFDECGRTPLGPVPVHHRKGPNTNPNLNLCNGGPPPSDQANGLGIQIHPPVECRLQLFVISIIRLLLLLMEGVMLSQHRHCSKGLQHVYVVSYMLLSNFCVTVS